MPSRVKNRRCPRCGRTHKGERAVCDTCSPKEPRKRDERPSSSSRGYGPEWRRVRARVLADWGIPEEDWPLYHVDHNPPYNKEVEPDHNAYELIPRLISEHNRKTATEDTRRDSRGRFAGRA